MRPGHSIIGTETWPPGRISICHLKINLKKISLIIDNVKNIQQQTTKNKFKIPKFEVIVIYPSNISVFSSQKNK